MWQCGYELHATIRITSAIDTMAKLDFLRAFDRRKGCKAGARYRCWVCGMCYEDAGDFLWHLQIHSTKHVAVVK